MGARFEKEIRTGIEEEDPSIPAHPSQASHPSPIEECPSGSSLPSSDKDHRPSTSPAIVPPSEEISPFQQPQQKEQKQKQQHKKLDCFYCNQAYPDDKERIKYIGIEHPGKMFWPTPDDFENRL